MKEVSVEEVAMSPTGLDGLPAAEYGVTVSPRHRATQTITEVNTWCKFPSIMCPFQFQFQVYFLGNFVSLWAFGNYVIFTHLHVRLNILKVPVKQQACTQRPNGMMYNYQVQGIYYVRMASQHFSCSANPFACRTGKRGRDG